MTLSPPDLDRRKSQEFANLCEMFEAKGAKEGQQEKPGAMSRRTVKARRKLQFNSIQLDSDSTVLAKEDKNPFSKYAIPLSKFSKLEDRECQSFASVIISMERGHPVSELPSSLKRNRADSSYYEGVTGVKRFRLGSILEQ